MALRFCHAVHRPAELLSANVGFDLVAANVLGDWRSGLCHVVLSPTPKVSLGSGPRERLCLGYMGMSTGPTRVETGVSTSPKGKDTL